MNQVFLSTKQFAILMNLLQEESIKISEEEVRGYLENEEEFDKPLIISKARSFDEADDDEWESALPGSEDEKAAIEKMLEFAEIAGEDEKQAMFLRSLDVSISSDYERGIAVAIKALAEIVKIELPEESTEEVITGEEKEE